MIQLAFACSDGRIAPVDYDAAAAWWINAYEAGYEYAAVGLGRLYAYYMSRDSEAIEWLKIAADASEPGSFMLLAVIYDDRNSECFDPVEAVKWDQRAIAEGRYCVPRAMLALARHYRDGTGVPQSIDAARAWLRRLLAETPPSHRCHKEARTLLDELKLSLL